jgi:hypothetical protein
MFGTNFATLLLRHEAKNGCVHAWKQYPDWCTQVTNRPTIEFLRLTIRDRLYVTRHCKLTSGKCPFEIQRRVIYFLSFSLVPFHHSLYPFPSFIPFLPFSRNPFPSLSFVPATYYNEKYQPCYILPYSTDANNFNF